MKRKIVIITALSFWVLSVWGGIHFLNSRKTVYVLNKIKDQRTEIMQEDVVAMNIPRYLYLSSFIEEENDLVGKYVALGHTLYPQQFVHRESVEDIIEARDGIITQLMGDEKMFTTSVDIQSSGGNTIRKDQFVDIYIRLTSKKTEPVVQELVRHARVLAVKDRKGEEANDSVPVVMVLAVTQESYEVLLRGDEMGELVYTLSSRAYESGQSEVNEEGKRMIDGI
ncbi:MAG: RcpC/CpaB family pilus assembly protein [Erysipelothrix sp.]